MENYIVETEEYTYVKIVTDSDELIWQWWIEVGGSEDQNSFTQEEIDRTMEYLDEGKTIHKESEVRFRSYVRVDGNTRASSPIFHGDSAQQSRNELRNWLNRMLHDMKTGVL